MVGRHALVPPPGVEQLRIIDNRIDEYALVPWHAPSRPAPPPAVLVRCPRRRRVGPSPGNVALRAPRPRRLSHPSGRPWLVGRWPEARWPVGQAGPVKHRGGRSARGSTADQLAEAAAPGPGGRPTSTGWRVAGRQRPPDRLGRRRGCGCRAPSPGSGGSSPRWSTARRSRPTGPTCWPTCSARDATSSGSRCTCWSRTSSTRSPACRCGAAWSCCASDSYLVLDGGQRHRRSGGGRPPEPVVPMAEGAAALREALSAAVDIRVAGRELVSCDLGGLDSTAVCCAGRPRRAQGGRLHGGQPGPARRRRGLGGADRRRAARRRAPRHPGRGDAAGLRRPRHGHRRPRSTSRARPPWTASVGWSIARRAAARGSGLHLTGFGGDELLYGSVAHLHDLLRTNPRVGLRPCVVSPQSTDGRV